MKLKTDEVVYGYNNEGIYTQRMKVREDPLIPGHFPPPARTTTITPLDHGDEEEIVLTDNIWRKRLKKTEPPSIYHKWDDQKGWEISQEDQLILTKEIG